MGDGNKSERGVLFEPGIHTLGMTKPVQEVDQILRGNPDVHAWNSEIKERLIGHKPGIVAVDSMVPAGVYDANGLTLEDKAVIWNLMPGKPRELNGSDSILALAGDNLYGFPDTYSAFSIGIRVANAAALVAGSNYVVRQVSGMHIDSSTDTSKNQEGDISPRHMSRRKFLGNLASLIAVGIVGSELIASESPWGLPLRPAESVATAYEDISIQRFIDQDHVFEFLTGRTALLIAKMHDALNMGIYMEPKRLGSVVMGDAHMYEVEELLQDPKKRASCIRRHTELMLQIARKSNIYFSSHWSPRERQKWVMRNQASMQLYRVRELDYKRFKTNPRAELDRIIQLEQTVTSPSVSAAIDGLLVDN